MAKPATTTASGSKAGPAAGRRSPSNPPGAARAKAGAAAKTPDAWTPERAETPSQPAAKLSTSDLAAKFPWAAQFANAKLDVALWGDSADKMGKNNSKKENLNELFDEIAKLTNEHDNNAGAQRNAGDGASFFDGGQDCVTDPNGGGGGAVGDMTETWGGAVALTNSVQFGNSGTLASEDVLAAALR